MGTAVTAGSRPSEGVRHEEGFTGAEIDFALSGCAGAALPGRHEGVAVLRDRAPGDDDAAPRQLIA